MAFEFIATILSTMRAMQAFHMDKSMRKGTFTYFMLQQGTLRRKPVFGAIVYASTLLFRFIILCVRFVKFSVFP